jgi:hypothetical protein
MSCRHPASSHRSRKAAVVPAPRKHCSLFPVPAMESCGPGRDTVHPCTAWSTLRTRTTTRTRKRRTRTRTARRGPRRPWSPTTGAVVVPSCSRHRRRRRPSLPTCNYSSVNLHASLMRTTCAFSSLLLFDHLANYYTLSDNSGHKMRNSTERRAMVQGVFKEKFEKFEKV